MAEGYAGVGGYYLYRQILVGYVRAYLFARPHAGEYCHGGCKGYETRLGKARRYTHHVLFRYAHVIEPVGEFICEELYCGGLFKVGCDADYLVVVFRKGGKGAPIYLLCGHSGGVVCVPVGSCNYCHCFSLPYPLIMEALAFSHRAESPEA